MKRVLPILGLLFISSTAFANQIECKVHVFLTDKAGYLMPLDKDVLVSTKVDGNCGSSTKKIGNLEVGLCAKRSDLLGVYMVSAAASKKGSSEVTAVGSVGTRISDTTALEVIHQESEISLDIVTTLEENGITAPRTYTGDSLQIDDAIEAGMKAGVLKDKELVTVVLDTCRLK